MLLKGMALELLAFCGSSSPGSSFSLFSFQRNQSVIHLFHCAVFPLIESGIPADHGCILSVPGTVGTDGAVKAHQFSVWLVSLRLLVKILGSAKLLFFQRLLFFWKRFLRRKLFQGGLLLLLL